MRLPLRYQVLIPLVVLLLGVLGGGVWVAADSARRAIRQQVEDQLRQVARTLAEANFPLTPKVLDQVKNLSGADYLLWDRDGQTLSTLTPSTASLPPDETAGDWAHLRLGPTVSVAGQNYLPAHVWLHRPAPAIEARLCILYPEARWQDTFWAAVRPSLLLGLAGGVLALALAWAIAGWLAQRIRSLQERTRCIAAGDFRPMPEPAGNDELRDLAGSINDMATQLARLQEAMRQSERLRLLGQVSGGLAHQMRNAIAGARLAVQLHARTCSGGADAEALDVALRQLALAEEKLQRFLQGGQEERPCLRPLALAEVLDGVTDLLRPKCRHTGVALCWQPPAEAVLVVGDPGQLGHLFVNVLGNAIEAAGVGGTVELRVTRECRPAGDFALVEVHDSGPGPPAAIAEQLFEDFVTAKPEGVGLGLAVARRVARAHGGDIRWRRATNRTCFQVLLPLVSDA